MHYAYGHTSLDGGVSLNVIQFAQSTYWPIAIGFFGLSLGFLMWGGQALFGFPKSSKEVDRTMGMWGFWMPGFMQFLTGIYLMVGLTWFGVYTKSPSLYMAALAFTAFGIHWFVMAHRRYVGSSEKPDFWMAIAFLFMSILGLLVFFGAGDIPSAILFIGLTLIYATEVPAQFSGSKRLAKIAAFWKLLTGIWLMYLTYAATLNFALGQHWWI